MNPETEPVEDICAELYAGTQRDRTPIDQVWHYTSLDGLVGLMKEQQMWASHVAYVNDSSEWRTGLGWLTQGVAIHGKRAGSESPDARVLEQFAAFSQSMLDELELYIACFTTEGNFLSQWRGYCPTTKGVSIGFDTEQLMQAAKANGFSLGRCVYSGSEQRHFVERILNSVLRLVKSYPGWEERLEAEWLRTVFMTIWNPFSKVIVLMKNWAYHAENEWRMVATSTGRPENPVLHRTGVSMLVPYLHLPLPLNASGNLDLKSVYLGPTPHVKDSMRSLTSYLSCNGSLPPPGGVQYCDMPFRAW